MLLAGKLPVRKELCVQNAPGGLMRSWQLRHAVVRVSYFAFRLFFLSFCGHLDGK